jgi:hypothetical protein
VYYALWLVAGLLVVAGISFAVALRWRRTVLRRAKAAELMRALSHYSDWVASQQRTAVVHGAASEGDASLRRVQALRQQWFPEFHAEAAQIRAVHEHLIEFLQSQFTLRMSDAEAWLDSDPDAGYMALWAQHQRATGQLAHRLTTATGVLVPGEFPESIFPGLTRDTSLR